MSSLVRQLSIPGPAGALEAVLNLPDERNGELAVVCHPHPLHGGTMHSHVVYHTSKALRERGFVVLRFNFRGVGRSEGSYDEGRGEQHDLSAALDFLCGEHPGAAALVAGFSFGSVVGAQVTQRDPRVSACIGIGLPVLDRPTAWLGEVRKPFAVVQGGGDPYGPPSTVRNLLRQVPGPCTLEEIPEAGHFFPEHFNELRAAISRAVDWCVEARIAHGT